MASIKGYKYNTEQLAQEAVNLCNTYYQIPQSPNDITQNWCDYKYAKLNNPTFWYIIYDESLVIVLGEPITFEVIYATPV